MKSTHGTVVAVLALASCSAFCQAPAAAPAFEVASIKPSPPLNPNAIMSGQMHVGMKTDAARVDIGFMSLTDLIRTAYDVKEYQISGPDWMKSQRFDIQAKLPDGATTDQVPQMLQALLADRFKLTLHRDTAPNPVYALIVGKGGLKIKPSEPDPAVPAAPVEPPKGAITIGDGNNTMQISGSAQGGRGLTITGSQTGTMHLAMSSEGAMHLEMEKIGMPALADTLSRFVDRPVVDMTKLKGNYQISLELSQADLMVAARTIGATVGMPMPMEAPRQGDAASDPSSSSVFATVQKLGLKLDPQKLPIERLVIDHVEKTPTEN